MKIDFIDAAVKSYVFIASAFSRLLRLVWIPVLIKFCCFLAVVFLGLSNAYLRQGLVFLPSYFVEGWFVAYAMRLAVLGESYQSLLTGDVKHDEALLRRRALHMKVTMIIYVLTRLISAMMAGLFLTYYGLSPDGTLNMQAAPLPAYGFIFVLGCLAGTIWAFRYLWLYVPPALGIGVRAFLRRLGGFMASFHLIAIWMICLAPVYLVLILISDVIYMIFPGGSIETGPLLFVILSGGLQSLIEIVMATVTSVAMAYAVMQMMQED